MLSVADASREMGIAVQTGYNKVANGTYPLPIVREPGSGPRVRLIHLVAYLVGDKVVKGRRGRPTVEEQAAKEKARELLRQLQDSSPEQ